MTVSTLTHRRRTINRDDPRVRRTLKLLGDTLLELIIETGYEKVAIQDITDRAQMSRTTFYLHFRDKDELLFETMRALYDDLTASTHAIDFNDIAAAEAAMQNPADFIHVEKYFHFYKVMFSEQGSMSFLLRVHDYLATTMLTEFERGKPDDLQPRIPLPVVTHVAAGAEIGLILWWVRHDMPHTPADMARFLSDAQCRGVWWALGLDGKS